MHQRTMDEILIDACIYTSAFLPKPIWARVRFPCSPPGVPLTNVGPHHTATRARIEPNSQPFLWHVELLNAVNFGEINIKFSRRDWSTSATGRISIHAMGETALSAIWVHSEAEVTADDPAITKIIDFRWPRRHATTTEKLINGSAQSTYSFQWRCDWKPLSQNKLQKMNSAHKSHWGHTSDKASLHIILHEAIWWLGWFFHWRCK